MKYPLFSNVKYVYKESIKRYPKMKFFLLINFLSSILVPLFSTLIPTIVVYAMTKEVGLDKYALIILGISFISFVLISVRYYSFRRYEWENTVVRCTTFWIRLSKHQMEIDYENIEPKDKQMITSKAFEALSSNWVGIEMMLKQTPVFFYNIVGLIVYGVLISIYCPIVLPILILMSVANFFLTKRANKFVEKTREEANNEWREKNYLAGETTNINNGKDIRVYRLDRWFSKLFVILTKRRTILTKKINQKFLFAQVSDTIFLMIRDLVAYFALIKMVFEQKIEVATLIFLIGIVAGFTSWLNSFLDSFNNLRTANILVNEYRSCLETKNRFLHEGGLKASDISLPIKIEFKNVSFKYPDAEEPTIKNLSFTIEKGEKVALVGHNGAGKTTIIKLLCGLYAPTEGEILINGHNLMDINIDEYTKLLSVFFQDSEPLALTILNNVCCCREDQVDYERFWKAVEEAGLKDKIKELEHQENTFITQVFDESGIRLSGGETQKLLFARALYKNAPLLILDEPTAALDPISEEQMYLRYAKVAAGHTSIFISHRLSSTKFCDRILYLENGQIIESGIHYELIEKGGKYKEVFDIQSQYYKEEAIL